MKASNVKYDKNYLTQMYTEIILTLTILKWEDVIVNTEWDGYTTMQPQVGTTF